MPFVATKTLSSVPPNKTQRYRVSTSAVVYIGDTVRVSSGVVKAATAVSASNTILGVAARFYDANGKPFTHAAPARGLGKPAATSGFVDVYDNPHAVFVCTVDACSTQASAEALIGSRIGVTAGTPNTALGISGQKLLGSTVLTTAGEGTWRVVGASPLQVARGDSTNSFQLEVVPAFHLLG
jgi:hypothetical protein